MKAVGKTDSERKTQSRERMKDMGLSSIQANIDQRTRERLISLCDEIGINTIKRDGRDSVNSVEFGIVLSMLLDPSQLNKRLRPLYAESYTKWLYGVMSSFAEPMDGKYDLIAERLNEMNVKRPSFFDFNDLDDQLKGKWSAEHLSPLMENDNFDDIRMAFPYLK